MTQTNTPDPAFDEPMSEAEWEAAQAWTDHANHLVVALTYEWIDAPFWEVLGIPAARALGRV